MGAFITLLRNVIPWVSGGWKVFRGIAAATPTKKDDAIVEKVDRMTSTVRDVGRKLREPL